MLRPHPFVLSLSKDVLRAMRLGHALRRAQCERM